MPARLGAVVVGMALFLRADAAMEPAIDAKPPPPPRPAQGKARNRPLPAPIFGSPQRPMAAALAAPSVRTSKAALLSSASRAGRTSGMTRAAAIRQPDAQSPVPPAAPVPAQTPDPLAETRFLAAAVGNDAGAATPPAPETSEPEKAPEPPSATALSGTFPEAPAPEAEAAPFIPVLPLPGFGGLPAPSAGEADQPTRSAPALELASSLPSIEVAPQSQPGDLDAPPSVPAPAPVAVPAEPPPSLMPEPAFGGDAPELPAAHRPGVVRPAPSAQAAEVLPAPARRGAVLAPGTGVEGASAAHAAREPSAPAASLPSPQFGGLELGELPPEQARFALQKAALVYPVAQALHRSLPGAANDDAVAAPRATTAPGAQSHAMPQPAPSGVQTASAARTAAGDAMRPGAGPPEFGYDDELVLEIRTADGTQGDTLLAYGTRSGVYLPLGAMARFLDLAIAVSDDGHFASGWFLDESRRFSLDLRQREMQVEGRGIPIAANDAAAFEGELYLRTERFAQIFPLDIQVNLQDQSITLRTREPFPFEQRIARESQRERLSARGLPGTGPGLPRESTPWRALTFPMADVELRGVSDRTMGSRMEGDVRLAGDFAFMTGQAFLSATTRDGLVGARLSLGRRDPDSRLLGPLHASEFQLGDVSTTAMPMGLRGTSGRGLFLTNRPFEQVSLFDRVDLRGGLPDGYEVELYRNNVLVGSTRTAVNGQYEFLQVPVEFGLNVMRLVFYGPQGQRREEVRKISVGDGRLAGGQLVYDIGVVQKDANLLGIRGPDFTPTQDYGSWRHVAQLAYGVSPALTAAVSGAWFQSDSGNHWVVEAGLRGSVAGLATRVDVAAQDGGGRALSLGLGGKVLGIGFRATRVEYKGPFIDEVRVFSSEPLRRVTEVELSGSLALGGHGFTLPFSARYERVAQADGRVRTNALLRGSARVGTLMLSNTLEYSRNALPASRNQTQMLGSFDLATLSASRTRLRLSANYELRPQLRMRAAGVEMDRELDEKSQMRATVMRSFEDRETVLGLSASRRFGKFSLAFDGSWGVPHGQYSALLRLGFSFGRNPLSGRFFANEPGLASSGAIALRAFRDTDDDGRFDGADEPLEKVRFSSGGQRVATGANGVALMAGLAGGTRTGVQIDPDSLPDIAMDALEPGKQIVPRPGRIHVTEFAVQELSDIEGTALFGTERRQRGVSGLALCLVDSAGAVVRTTRSEADGFYLFEQVKPGRYSIVLDADQSRRLGIAMIQDVALEVDRRSAVIRRDLSVRAGGPPGGSADSVQPAMRQ